MTFAKEGLVERKNKKQVQSNRTKVRKKNDIWYNWFILIMWLCFSVYYVYLGERLLVEINDSIGREVVDMFEQFINLLAMGIMMFFGALLIIPAVHFIHLWYIGKLNPITLLLGDLK